MGRRATLVQGVGVNDIPGSSSIPNGGKLCRYYATWSAMIQRCYSKSYQVKKPWYIGVTVCDDWLIFSNFKAWMEQQDWHGKELDKDILSFDGKKYSPETCCFVTSLLNNFFRPPTKNKLLPQGVRLNPSKMKFYCEVFNPFKWKNEKSVLFDTPDGAHAEWKRMKLCIAEELLRSEKDHRILAALRIRFSSDQ